MSHESIEQSQTPCLDCGKWTVTATRADEVNAVARVGALFLATLLVVFLTMETLQWRVMGQGTMPERVQALETKTQSLQEIDARNERDIANLREQVSLLASNVNRIVGTSASLAALLLIAQVVDYISRRRGRR